ncbi:hypothetical protein HFP89_06135 [Wenzhouxiangella sp. XN79A]|uniref:choice-of-anchor Q domain-containing protein n=1 Tax=Wenzhouxiangella sp. XN79A TaxID=2724193 RepID=UPI00144AE28A|nr:choice-of-anchor Q domain-containing protein [Wenzhouxiangella sp. XN79A]NKI34740.1 hypothetical protein [Wenzhouxiangella sp. XN79A]
MNRITRTLLAAGLLALMADAANALNFQVNTVQDLPEVNPGDGFCQPEGAILGFCTLRAAIMEANASPGNHVITLPASNLQFILSRDGALSEDGALTGDLDIHGHITIRSNGGQRPTVSGGFIDRVFDVHPGATLIIENVDVGGGISTRGGAIRVRATSEAIGILAIENAWISLNIAEEGGAIHNGGAMILNRVELFNNALTDDELGVFARGAAIFNSGEAYINNSTLRTNGVIPGGGADLVPDPHVIFNVRNVVTEGPHRLVISNSTIYDNTNGIFSDGVATALKHVTMTNNGAEGLVLSPNMVPLEPHFAIEHSVIHGHGKDCNDFPIGDPVYDVNGNFNASSDTSCGFGGLDGFENITDPFADDPVHFDGATTVLMPHFDSVLIDPVGGDCAELPTDQRGMARPVDGNDDGLSICDIGAVEYDPFVDPNGVFSDSFENS